MRIVPLLALAVVSACAPVQPASAPAPAGAATADSIPLAIRWFRNSAEQRVLYHQVYRAAGDRLRELAVGQAPGSWAVILDADETVLDNSEYQIRIARRGLRFDTVTWNAWAREETATALPGAVEFTRLARELGGRVAIVTNRDASVCPHTRRNLERLGVPVDAVLCQDGPSDKNPRFHAVEQGVEGLPPVRVLLWVGDNIRDFPGQDQPLRTAPQSALSPFGDRWFLLPNPMYGSWERLPNR